MAAPAGSVDDLGLRQWVGGEQRLHAVEAVAADPQRAAEVGRFDHRVNVAGGEDEDGQQFGDFDVAAQREVSPNRINTVNAILHHEHESGESGRGDQQLGAAPRRVALAGRRRAA